MRRAVISTSIAFVAVIAVGVYGAISDPGATKPGAGVLRENEPSGDAPPVPGETLATTPEPFTVPVSDPARAKNCPQGWEAFDNTVAHYSLCYPPGWGFSELDTPERLEQLRSVTLGTVRLLSPIAFPWRVGDSVFDAVVERGAIAVELNVVPSGSSTDPANPTCALTSRVVGGTPFEACEELRDLTGARAALGPIHVLRIAVPLLRAPVRTQPYPPSGSQLQIIVRSLASNLQEEASLIWQIARTIRAY